MNRIAKQILMLTFVIIYAVPIYWIAQGKVVPQKSVIERRTLAVFPTLSLQDSKMGIKHLIQGRLQEADRRFFIQFLTRKYQKKFESAANDQYPLRIQALHLGKALDRTIISIAYGFLEDPATPVDLRSNYYKMRREDTLIFRPASYKKNEYEIAIDRRVNNYKELIKSFPELNFYVFAVPTLYHTEFHPLNIYFNGFAGNKEIDYFTKTKPKVLNFSTLNITSYEDYFQYFYRTDHHWNVYGSLRGYEIIYKMISSNYPEISPMLTPKEIFTFPDIEFLGSIARTSLYPVKGDKFEVALFDLPLYETRVNGKETDLGRGKDYLSGIYSTQSYIDHYTGFYGGSINFIEFTYNNKSNHNLLIIGNSYKTPVQQILASHYNHTYSISFKDYRDFSLSEFIKQHPVDDVLILADYNPAFMSKEWMIEP